MPEKVFESGIVVNNVGTRVHPDYTTKIKLWNFLLASYRGGMGMEQRYGMNSASAQDQILSGYFPGLYQWGRESDADYDTRVALTPYRPYARNIVQAFANYVTKKEPERNGVESHADLIDNVDGRGTNMLSFVRTTLALQAVLGEISILVDMPLTDGKSLVSRQDQIDKGIIPYATVVLPQTMVDWSYGENGKYNWVLIESQWLENSIQAEQAVTRTRRTYWDKNIWQIYEEVGGAWALGKNEKGEYMEGEHPCKEVPIIRISIEDLDNNPLTPESWFFDLADINRAIYNLDAVDISNLCFQTFGTMIIPASNQPPGSEDSSEAARKIARSQAISEEAQESGISRFIQPAGSSAEAFDRKIEVLAREMIKVAGLDPQKETKAPESALSKAWGFERTNQFLAAFGKNGNRIEEGIYELANRWENKPEGNESVKYPDDYAVKDLVSTVATMLDLKQLGWDTETGRKEALKSAFRALLPDLPRDKQLIIEQEIDASKEPTTVIDQFVTEEE